MRLFRLVELRVYFTWLSFHYKEEKKKKRKKKVIIHCGKGTAQEYEIFMTLLL